MRFSLGGPTVAQPGADDTQKILLIRVQWAEIGRADADMSPVDQSELFSEPEPTVPERDAGGRPLAVRMRPRRLSEVVGQDHILGSGSLLSRLVAQNQFGSLLFYGPPGTGKTSIAEAIALETKSRFVRVNAVMSNAAELRDVLSAARRAPGAKTILFIDELHRFNKTQQDLLLPDVEQGAVRLIGATTHNPGFYINPPLLSRSHLFRLEPLSTEAVAGVLARALADAERGLGGLGVTASAKILADLAVFCDGDLRRAPERARGDRARKGRPLGDGGGGSRGVRPREADPLRRG